MLNFAFNFYVLVIGGIYDCSLLIVAFWFSPFGDFGGDGDTLAVGWNGNKKPPVFREVLCYCGLKLSSLIHFFNTTKKA